MKLLLAAFSTVALAMANPSLEDVLKEGAVEAIHALESHPEVLADLAKSGILKIHVEADPSTLKAIASGQPATEPVTSSISDEEKVKEDALRDAISALETTQPLVTVSKAATVPVTAALPQYTAPAPSEGDKEENETTEDEDDDGDATSEDGSESDEEEERQKGDEEENSVDQASIPTAADEAVKVETVRPVFQPELTVGDEEENPDHHMVEIESNDNEEPATALLNPFEHLLEALNNGVHPHIILFHLNKLAGPEGTEIVEPMHNDQEEEEEEEEHERELEKQHEEEEEEEHEKEEKEKEEQEKEEEEKEEEEKEEQEKEEKEKEEEEEDHDEDHDEGHDEDESDEVEHLLPSLLPMFHFGGFPGMMPHPMHFQIHFMNPHFAPMPPMHIASIPPMPAMAPIPSLPPMAPMNLGSILPSLNSMFGAGGLGSQSGLSNVEEVTFGPNGGQVHEYGTRADGSKYDITVPVKKGSNVQEALNAAKKEETEETKVIKSSSPSAASVAPKVTSVRSTKAVKTVKVVPEHIVTPEDQKEAIRALLAKASNAPHH